MSVVLLQVLLHPLDLVIDIVPGLLPGFVIAAGGHMSKLMTLVTLEVVGPACFVGTLLWSPQNSHVKPVLVGCLVLGWLVNCTAAHSVTIRALEIVSLASLAN